MDSGYGEIQEIIGVLTMAFTLLGYFQTLDTGGVLTYINPLADPHVRVEGKNIIVPRGLNYLAGVLALSPNMSQARLESPSLRQRVLYDIAGVDKNSYPEELTSLNALFENPIELMEDEGLRLLAAETAAGAEDVIGLVWLSDGALAPVGGDIWTVRATTDTITQVNAWTNVALNFDQTLPVGRYQVVGCYAFSTQLVAIRFVFVGFPWRPGVIGRNDISKYLPSYFRRGGLGVWGEFDHTQPPTVDVFSRTQPQIIELYIDLVKVA